MSANGNADFAFGLRSTKSRLGADPSGEIYLAAILAADPTDTFIGSPLKYSGDAHPTRKVPSVQLADPGDAVMGVVTRFEPVYGSGLNNDNNYRQGGSERMVHVALADPNREFEVQANAALTTDMVGQLFDLTAEVGTVTAFGRSTVELDVATQGAADGQVRLLRILDSVNNDFDAADPGTCCIVTFNENKTAAAANAGD